MSKVSTTLITDSKLKCYATTFCLFMSNFIPSIQRFLHQMFCTVKNCLPAPNGHYIDLLHSEVNYQAVHWHLQSQRSWCLTQFNWELFTNHMLNWFVLSTSPISHLTAWPSPTHPPIINRLLKQPSIILVLILVDQMKDNTICYAQWSIKVPYHHG